MAQAERMVGEARMRRRRALPRREAIVRGISGAAFVLVAAVIAAALPSERANDTLLIFGLIAGYALVSRVRFEFGDGYVVPEQLVFVPMLALAPLPLVPAMVAAGAVIALVPDFVRRTWHWDRTITTLGDCWFAVGPVLLLAALAPEEASLAVAEVYVLAFLAQLGGDLAWTLVRNEFVDRVPLGEMFSYFGGCARVDAILSPIAFLVSLGAASAPIALIALGPLVWLLEIFSRDRRERYAAALELNRAYRGTVMLLSDVLEFEDEYTARHSRSVVDLVDAVANELGVDRESRQELEFAAMLHDVGKISIPKELLRKSSRLTAKEVELIKSHTIEGQFILDRIGGVLARVGEIVRSCHERWDGRGYPDGLAGEDIPLASRIVFACDAYNAMTTDRPYRKALDRDSALAELRANAGTQFDPRVVAAVVQVVQRGEPVAAATDDVRAVLVNSQIARGATSAT
jgi:HD-GYP domain-containing protein (c-di-GMP phosphodiesterase class II)